MAMARGGKVVEESIKRKKIKEERERKLTNYQNTKFPPQSLQISREKD